MTDVGLMVWLQGGWWLWLALLAMVLAIYALWPGNRTRFETAARLALDDPESGGPKPACGKEQTDERS